MKEKPNFIKKIKKYLKENKKDGLLIYEEDHSEPYFYELTKAHCSIQSLLYIPAEEKPKCLVSNMEINAIKSTGLFEEENVIESKLFQATAKDFLKDLEGKKILANFSEKNPSTDQLPHSFFKEYLQNLSVESSEKLWKNIGLKIKIKENIFTTHQDVKKTRVEELKQRVPQNMGLIMVNGIGKAALETYACYLTGFSKSHKYAIAMKNGESVSIVHESENLHEHPFDKVITYKNIKEFQKIISDYFKDIKQVYCDESMTEGNHRLLNKTLEGKLLNGTKFVKVALAIKLPREIREIERSCKINDEIFDYLEKTLKPGVSEKKIKELIEKKALTYPEVLELFFPSLVAAGENGANIHHLTSDYKIWQGDLLLIDLGVKLKTGMGSDTTCMYYFGNYIPKRIKKYDEVMDKAITSAFTEIRPGRSKSMSTKLPGLK